MMMPLSKNSPLIKIINDAFIDLPSPSNISTLWNFGSLLGICSMIQILTGIVFAMHYSPDINYAFNSVSHICRDINYGWFIRTIHADGDSMFFICLYMHMGRGLYYSSFKLLETWIMRVLILLMTMATAFSGYEIQWSTNIILGSNINYQLNICYSLYRKLYCLLIMSSFCRS